MIVYHVDRAARLQAGQIITLRRTEDISNPDQQAYVAQLFGAEGISSFGGPYTRDNSGNLHQPIEWFKETVFEYVRRLWFPRMPSRFQSFFSVKSFEAALRWINIFDRPNKEPLVWEVEVSQALELDACWRDQNYYIDGQLVFDPAKTHAAAVQYWSGMISHAPRLELLSPLPVRIVRRVVD